jgi:uncharacterized protein affecting Mg2+/Co2+ transport
MMMERMQQNHGLINLSSFSVCFSTTTLTFENFNTTSIRLYRILMRLSRRLDYSKPLLKPLDHHDYGHARTFFMASSTHHDNHHHVPQEVFRWFKECHDKDPFVEEWFQSVSDFGPLGDEPKDDTLIWIDEDQLKEAIRSAFRTSMPDKLLVPVQRLAIAAIQSLQYQGDMQKRTSVSINVDMGIRVIATSSWFGISIGDGSKPHNKYRFAYRIRVENLPTTTPNATTTTTTTTTVQLLGRTWHIQDLAPDGGGMAVPLGEPIHVFMPTNGVVGHLPVLEPGQVFEYMSGCELDTPRGVMDGCFHMAVVPPKTKSGAVGDAISPHLQTFEMPVEPFSLLAD